MASDNSSQRRHDASADGVISQNEATVKGIFSLSADGNIETGESAANGEEVRLQSAPIREGVAENEATGLVKW